MTAENRVTKSVTVSVHDSVREVGDMATEFLTNFSKSDVSVGTVMKDFTPSCSGTAEEKQDVEDNRAEFIITSYESDRRPSASTSTGAVRIATARRTRARTRALSGCRRRRTTTAPASRKASITSRPSTNRIAGGCAAATSKARTPRLPLHPLRGDVPVRRNWGSAPTQGVAVHFLGNTSAWVGDSPPHSPNRDSPNPHAHFVGGTRMLATIRPPARAKAVSAAVIAAEKPTSTS